MPFFFRKPIQLWGASSTQLSPCPIPVFELLVRLGTCASRWAKLGFQRLQLRLTPQSVPGSMRKDLNRKKLITVGAFPMRT
ncbi:hypothetical protein CGRA01v4_07539 [Colletotrichum graminicola]|nr:hypothetical protein CGRA01v4_07539 [Colletotrichum graminicola]